MRLLLDTHTWLWWHAGDERLGPLASALIADPDNDVVLSAVVPWEVVIKRAVGRLELKAPPDALVSASFTRNGMTPLSVELSHALRVAELPLHHADPFDRLLVAQAQVENLSVVTADATFGRYHVEIVDASS